MEEKSGAVQRVKELEDKMLDVEKENAELKRRIELISSLRNSKPAASHHEPRSNHQEDAGEGSIKGTDEHSSTCEQAEAAVDSAWSQAQAFGSDASSQSQRLQELLRHELLEETARSGIDRSSQQSSMANDEDFYNPMPMKNFNKNYQPSLAFGSSHLNANRVGSYDMPNYSRPGIELISGRGN